MKPDLRHRREDVRFLKEGLKAIAADLEKDLKERQAVAAQAKDLKKAPPAAPSDKSKSQQ
jgi:hypothetical protein